jgi:hypothetical protein
VIGTVPLGSWETITFVAALRNNKMTAPMVIEGAMTGEMFLLDRRGGVDQGGCFQERQVRETPDCELLKLPSIGKIFARTPPSITWPSLVRGRSEDLTNPTCGA